MAEIKYGLSADGFKRKRLPEIKSGIEKRISDKLGVPIQTRPDSTLGQIIGVISYELADLWEQGEKTYNAMYPHTAGGVSLSNAAALAGIRPLAAEQTSVIVTCYGKNNTLLPFASQIRSNTDQKITFSTFEDTYITSSTANHVQLSVLDITPGTVCSMALGGISVTYTIQVGDKQTQVLSALSSSFVGVDDKISTLSNDILAIETVDQRKTFGVTVKNLTILQVGTPVNFLCDQSGSITPLIGELNQIVTQVAGWESAVNKIEAVVGRDAEVDINLRSRWSRSVYRRASAMVDAIQANVYQNVAGVTAALVYENTSDVTDADGRPAHSVETVVMGGSNTDIAKEIWRQKSAGIDTYGEVMATIADSQGVWHDIYFNRPTAINVWLKIGIMKNPDEDWGANTLNEAMEAVLKKGLEYKIGQDVVLQRFICSIFSNTAGVGYIEITASTGETPGIYSNANITISPRQIAVFDISRIEVIEIAAT